MSRSHGFLVSFKLEDVLGLFLLFLTLPLLKNIGQMSCRMSLTLCLWGFFVVKFRLCGVDPWTTLGSKGANSLHSGKSENNFHMTLSIRHSSTSTDSTNSGPSNAVEFTIEKKSEKKKTTPCISGPHNSSPCYSRISWSFSGTPQNWWWALLNDRIRDTQCWLVPVLVILTWTTWLRFVCQVSQL